MITIAAALKSLRLVLISVILLSVNLGLLLIHFFGLGWDTADLSYNYGPYSTGDETMQDGYPSQLGTQVMRARP